MKQSPSSSQKIQGNKKILFILLGASFVTLYININIYDPINTPKLYASLLLLPIILPNLILELRQYLVSATKLVKVHLAVSILLIVFLLFAALVSDSKYRAFVGETQRRNGFLLYFSLICSALYCAYFFRSKQIQLVYQVVGTLTLVLSGYGLLQYLGKDFIAWNNPYNSVIGTLGNPNFMAGLLSILSTLCFSAIFIRLNFHLRIFAVLLTIFSLGVIVASNALQGLISAAIGYSVIILFVIFQKNKASALFLGLGMSIFAVFVIMGMLQKGPLVEYLYKESVSLRGYYWRAGIKMFVNNPIFGVGLDSYGEFFKIFRENNYPLLFGYSLNSNNAHNVPIQFLATGGIFVFILYISIISLVLWAGIKSIFGATENEKKYAVGLFAAYIAYLAQGFVSIDNIGITIWGWVLSGLIIGNYRCIIIKKLDENMYYHKNQSIIKSVTTWTIASIIAVFSIFLHQMERNFYLATTSFNPNLEVQDKNYIDFLQKIDHSFLMDPFYKLQIANLLARSNEIGIDLALDEIIKLNQSDPENLSILYQLAEIYEVKNEPENLSKVLEKASKRDPQNIVTFMRLAKLHIAKNESGNAQKYLEKIIELNPNSIEAKEASDLKQTLESANK